MSHVHVIRTTTPDVAEYAPHYANYVGQVRSGDIVETLATLGDSTVALLRSIPDAKGGVRYAPGKWSIREVIGHITDAERIFTYRALRFARADATPLAPFDEDAFVANAALDERSLPSLIDEFEAVRRATVLFFASLNATEWMRVGTASGKQMSVRGAAWVTAGHALHHVGILKSRYL